MGEFLIEAVGLRKSFKGRPALDGLDLLIPTGSVFGFLGRKWGRENHHDQAPDGLTEFRRRHSERVRTAGIQSS